MCYTAPGICYLERTGHIGERLSNGYSNVNSKGMSSGALSGEVPIGGLEIDPDNGACFFN